MLSHLTSANSILNLTFSLFETDNASFSFLSFLVSQLLSGLDNAEQGRQAKSNKAAVQKSVSVADANIALVLGGVSRNVISVQVAIAAGADVNQSPEATQAVLQWLPLKATTKLSVY
jgi:hypothetical protein